MIKLACFPRFAFPLFSAALLFGAGGCARQLTAPPSEAPHVTSAVLEPAPIASPTVVVSPNVSVSAEIAAACKLSFNDVNSAPKFDFDESALGAQDSDTLTQIGACLTTGPLAGRSLELVGRADPRGESEYNLALGERRASSVHEYLTRLGVETARIVDSSRGKLDAIGTEENGWKRDRRVDILLR